MTVLDTNIVIYLLEGRLTDAPMPARPMISVISEIELFSHDGLRPEGETAIRTFLRIAEIVELTSEIKEGAISLRRRNHLTIPDAIIAATAVSRDAELWTNDAKLSSVAGLRCRSLPLKPPLR